MKKIATALIFTAVIVNACGPLNKLATGTMVGTGAGALLGAAVGALIGDEKGAAIGAAVGAGVGAGAGAIIGHQMDKKAAELAELENAKVQTVTDYNGLEGIKVTFESGILFPTNGTTLSQTSKDELAAFASKMSDFKQTDLNIFGHTDNTGGEAVNKRISTQRADAVATFLKSKGINADRITTWGMSYDEPIATNDTAEGRAQNRRVEIYITANEEMIAAAEALAKKESGE
jgi:outer membrane protein OmpA-like peptidoglycan-associated protein